MTITNEQIQAGLARVEREHGVRVFYAVESGSRAWGFASRDSDYDVRFIYAHDCDWYLSVHDRRDVIEEPVSDGLDLSGRDVRKALRLLAKSNPSLHEWIKSPIVYRADPAFALLFGLLASEFHSPARSFRHYLRIAQGNYRSHLRGETVRLKKYLYVLRPVLACRWIERGLGPVPMKFETLADAMIDDANLRFHVAVLVARKRAGEELDCAQHIPVIRAFHRERAHAAGSDRARRPRRAGDGKTRPVFPRILLRGGRMNTKDLTGSSADEPGRCAPWRQWGEGLEAEAVRQMANACALPVAVAGALMPDAHPGYGLPIGGVLATDNTVVPYAVGVDIACRMKLTVYERKANTIGGQRDRLANIIESETRFGMGCEFKQRRDHDVMDEDWTVSPVTKRLRHKAWAQLGTSGSGNHFVEFGEFSVATDDLDIPPGAYVALLSHSGSRGTGAQVCAEYSKRAMARHESLPKELKHLAWLSLDDADGQEYWAAMNLMGRYAAANHALIHKHIAKKLGADPILDIENHHNFAWKERHVVNGEEREVIVHRKGATPAGEGVLGVIPGSMASPGFVVRGRGQPGSLHSASHGAGRVMSRRKALQSFTWSATRKLLVERGVELLSAGLDEVPGVYKDIHAVMAAQTDLVDVLGKFEPKLVKMCPAGEKAED